MNYIPLTRLGYWQVAMDSISVAGDKGMACAGGCEAVMDTGTSLMAGPAEDVKAINEAIGAKVNPITGQGMTTCSSLNKAVSPSASPASWDSRPLMVFGSWEMCFWENTTASTTLATRGSAWLQLLDFTSRASTLCTIYKHDRNADNINSYSFLKK